MLCSIHAAQSFAVAVTGRNLATHAFPACQRALIFCCAPSSWHQWVPAVFTYTYGPGNDRKGRISGARLPGAQLGRLERVGPHVSQCFGALARLGDAAQTQTRFGLAHEVQGGKHDEWHHLRLARYDLGRVGRPGW
jgi:hypothetical protein